MAKHEEFLKQVKELAEDFERKLHKDFGLQDAIESGALFHDCANPQTVLNLLAIIEKLKTMVSHYEACATVNAYDDEVVECDCGLQKELDEIVGQG